MKIINNDNKIGLLSVGLVIVSLALSACTSSMQVTEFDKTADPSVEMNAVAAHIKNSKDHAVNVLAPSYYEDAVSSLQEAREARNDNKDQEKVLHKIAVARSYIDKADQTSNLGNQALGSVVQERQRAIDAQAQTYFPSEFESADGTLTKFGKKVEGGKTSFDDKERLKLELTYKSIALKSLKESQVGPAKANIEKAINEGAKELVPQTLHWAQNKVGAAEQAINANIDDKGTIEQTSKEAVAASATLLSRVREAKNVKQKTPEQLAKQSEELAKESQQVRQLENQSAEAEQQTAQARQEAAQARQEAAQTAAQIAWLEARYENARQKFSPEEAEVYKQGSELVIRLKGLSFTTAKSSLHSKDFALLAKVQAVLKDFGASTVVVEGHADSTGSKRINEKISAKRADAVKSYLVANNAVESDKIESKGVGYEKPISSNKSVAGRSQNRRVDILITPTNAAANEQDNRVAEPAPLMKEVPGSSLQ